MRNIYAMIKRNCILFLRSKQVVFFSFFSALILIVLYFLFIANLYAQGFNESAGMELSSNQINFAIYVQMIMGVLVIKRIHTSIILHNFGNFNRYSKIFQEIFQEISGNFLSWKYFVENNAARTQKGATAAADGNQKNRVA